MVHIANKRANDDRGGLAAWLPGGPVDPPARWAATSNAKKGLYVEWMSGPMCPWIWMRDSARINYLQGPRVSGFATADEAGLQVYSSGHKGGGAGGGRPTRHFRWGGTLAKHTYILGIDL